MRRGAVRDRLGPVAVSRPLRCGHWICENPDDGATRSTRERLQGPADCGRVIDEVRGFFEVIDRSAPAGRDSTSQFTVRTSPHPGLGGALDNRHNARSSQAGMRKPVRRGDTGQSIELAPRRRDVQASEGAGAYKRG